MAERPAPPVYTLPPGLPVPLDDGACRHLPGRSVPKIGLPSTSGQEIFLSALRGHTVVFCFPRAAPDEPVPAGWDEIPGARGCTPEACRFRDLHAELRETGAQVFGLSTQTTEFQREIVGRLQLPYALLSDARLAFSRALVLPTFSFNGADLIKRLTLVIQDGVIEDVFYPVFPPDRHADNVLSWLRQRRR